MINKLIHIVILLPLILKAQPKGTEFTSGLTWNQIVAKASGENKYIFVDCYATWCAPCKWMDKEVFSNDTVADFINSNFVAVKIQMDSIKTDKGLNSFAKSFKSEYKINVLPTYIFFSPNGVAVHKNVGAKRNVSDFMDVLLAALDPEKQSYTLLDNWRQGRIKYRQLPILIKQLEINKENEIAIQLAKEYIHSYLCMLDEYQFLQKDNIKFIGDHIGLVDLKDKILTCFSRNAKQIDSIMEVEGYCKSKINAIVYNNDILPYLKTADGNSKRDIDWRAIKKNIKKKYGKKIMLSNVLSAKANWYYDRNNSKEFIKAATNIISIEGYKNQSSFFLNAVAWEIFQYSLRRKYLRRAVIWATYAILINPKQSEAFVDTKANLLYKLGKSVEAMELEEKIINVHPSFKETLGKMKLGVPTWNTRRN